MQIIRTLTITALLGAAAVSPALAQDGDATGLCLGALSEALSYDVDKITMGTPEAAGEGTEVGMTAMGADFDCYVADGKVTMIEDEDGKAIVDNRN